SVGGDEGRRPQAVIERRVWGCGSGFDSGGGAGSGPALGHPAGPRTVAGSGRGQLAQDLPAVALTEAELVDRGLVAGVEVCSVRRIRLAQTVAVGDVRPAALVVPGDALVVHLHLHGSASRPLSFRPFASFGTRLPGKSSLAGRRPGLARGR